jgi:hypothetical protein
MQTIKIGRLTVNIQGVAGDYLYGTTASRGGVVVRYSTHELVKHDLPRHLAARAASILSAQDLTSDCQECVDSGIVEDGEGGFGYYCDCQTGRERESQEAYTM